MNKAFFIYPSFNLNNNAHGIGWFGTDDIRDWTDFNQSMGGLAVIIYNTMDSNNGLWGIDIIYSYFFNQYQKDVLILP